MHAFPKRKGPRRFLIFLAVVLLTVLFFSVVTPEAVIEHIGIQGGYMVLFILALLGVSSVVSASFYTTLVVLAASGEFNPFLMGLVAAPGRAVGDSLFFFLGLHSRDISSRFWLKITQTLSAWVDRFPRWMPMALTYGYTGFTPFPQDFLMVAMGLSGVRFRLVLPFLVLGNATFVIWFSLFVARMA